MKNILFLIFKGIFVGIANIIPGVSGGTIAVILDIFDEMIDAINNFFSAPKKHIKFLAPLGAGAVLGIILFSKIIKFGLENYSLPTNMFFAGLVIGSIPLIYNKATEKKDFSVKHIIGGIISFLIVAGFVVLEKNFGSSEESGILLHSDIPFLLKMFFGALIASSAMVIPGISGSFVMVLIGIYNYIINSISSLIDEIGNSAAMLSDNGFSAAFLNINTCDSFKILSAVGIGVIIGIIIISKLIALLLEKAYTLTYSCVLGLIFGSLVSIFFDEATYHSGVNPLMIIGGIISVIIGFFIALKLGSE